MIRTGLALLLLPALASAAEPVVAGPTPPWVEPVAPEPLRDFDGAVAFELVDEQLRVGYGPPERYHHTVARALTAAGVPEVARLAVDLEPSFEQVVVHAVRVHRGQRVIDALDLASLRKLQREQAAEADLYDGVVTALQFIPDVRVGDAVEIAYTTVGKSPVLGDGFADAVSLGWGVPVGRQLVRVIDRGGKLRFRVFGEAPPPQVHRRGEDVELRFEKHAVPASVEEDAVPPGVELYPWVQLSTFESWGEVAAWALALQPEADLAGASELLERARVHGPEEAVRFVQDEIRYLGIEDGVAGHVPAAPARVLERRWGDCKEKSLLLASLLRSIGIEAAPALVDTEDRGAVATRLPSPFAFDHAIVRAVVDGVPVWIDPTVPQERGPLVEHSPPPLGKALVIAPGVTDLETIPAPKEGASRTVITERYVVPVAGQSAQLDVESRYEGTDADETRRQLDVESRTDLQRRFLGFYEKLFPGVSVREPLEVEDDPARNRIRVKEHYVVPGFWEEGERGLWAHSITPYLRRPRVEKRRHPLEVEHPVQREHHIVVELPGGWDIREEREMVTSPAGSLVRKVKVQGRELGLAFFYTTRASSVAAGEVRAHLDALDRMADLSEYGIRQPAAEVTPEDVQPELRGAAWTALGALLGALVVALVLARSSRA